MITFDNVDESQKSDECLKSKKWDFPEKKELICLKINIEILPAFLACWPALQILDLSAPTTVWANSLK